MPIPTMLPQSSPWLMINTENQRNVLRIVLFRAPSAFNVPIICVRSRMMMSRPLIIVNPGRHDVALAVGGAVNADDKPFLNIRQVLEVLDVYLHACCLFLLPAIQLVGCIKVGYAEILVKACHVCLVNAANSISARPDITLVNEIGIYFVSGLQS